MKIINKKRLAILLGLLCLVAFLGWYFFPVLMAELFICKSGSLQKKYLNVRPTYITELPKPPSTWEDLSIDALVLKLPISKFTKISGKEDRITFAYGRSVLTFPSLVPSQELLKTLREMHLKYPLVSFEEKLAVLKVLPADLSSFNSRDENKRISASLVQKAVLFNPDYFGELLIFKSEMLKAICLISEKGKDGYHAVVDLYSPNGAVSITMILFWYKDKQTLDSDLLSILGGLTMPNRPLRADIVKKDIISIVSKYKRTEQQARPDGE